MEIRLRPIVAAFIVLAMVGALGYFTRPRLGPLAERFGLRPAATATVPAPAVTLAGGPDIIYLDQSLGWDWQAECAPQFRQFLAEKLPGRRINSLQIALVDYRPDSRLPFGVRYPDEAGPQADANCYELGGGAFTCSVGVERGEPSGDLDVAATLAAPYTLLDMFLARGANPNAVRQTWKWGTFQPLVAPLEEATNAWRSTCLRVSRAR